jgi:hypothetical protein
LICRSFRHAISLIRLRAIAASFSASHVSPRHTPRHYAAFEGYLPSDAYAIFRLLHYIIFRRFHAIALRYAAIFAIAPFIFAPEFSSFAFQFSIYYSLFSLLMPMPFSR